MQPATRCPNRDDLEDWILGRTVADISASLDSHVTGCSQCVQALRELAANDAVVEAMRYAAGPVLPGVAEAEPIIPWLKRIRPKEPTATFSIASNDIDTPDADISLPSFDFLAAPRQGGELGWLGHYRVLNVIGMGGMGMVFLAEDTRLKRRVALKAIKPELLSRSGLRERFLREAQAIAALEHDNIVAIFQVDEENGVPYLAMPLLKGESLEDRLRSAGGPLPVDDILRIGREVAAGLQAAHERSLVHRDIKPGNLWLEKLDGNLERIKILDFGLAQTIESSQEQAGTVQGTPGYMSPEQGRGLPADARSDLFSLGCVLYRVATGQGPFAGTDVLNVLLRLALEEPTPPTTLNPKLPKRLSELIVSLLEKEPKDRPVSAQEVGVALRSMEEERKPWPSRRRWWFATAAALLLGAGVAAWTMMAMQPSSEPGEITFHYNEADARLIVQLGDEPERTLELKSGQPVSLPPGDYALRPAVPSAERSLMPSRLLVKPGEKTTCVVRLVGELARRAEHSPHPVRGLALAAKKDGLAVYSVGEDRTIVLWKPKSSNRPIRSDFADGPLWCLALSPDEKMLATGSGDPTRKAGNAIRLWHAETLKAGLGTIAADSQVNAVAYSSDGNMILAAGNDGLVSLRDLRTGFVEAERLAHAGGATAIAFLPDGKRFLSAGWDGTLAEWTLLRRGSTVSIEPTRKRTDHTAAIKAMVIASGGKQVVTAGLDQRICHWDLEKLSVISSWKTTESIHALAVSTDGKVLLAGGIDERSRPSLRLWSLADQREILKLSGHQAGVQAVAFTPDGEQALSGDGRGVVILWQLPK